MMIYSIVSVSFERFFTHFKVSYMYPMKHQFVTIKHWRFNWLPSDYNAIVLVYMLA